MVGVSSGDGVNLKVYIRATVMWGRLPELHLSLFLPCGSAMNFALFGNTIPLRGSGARDFVSLS